VAGQPERATKARRQAEKYDLPDRFHSYWMPVAEGTTTVHFRVRPDDDRRASAGWFVRDVAVWSLGDAARAGAKWWGQAWGSPDDRH